RWDGQELERVQALDHREAGLVDTAFGGPPLAVQYLLFGQTQQVTRIVHALGGTLPRHFVVLTQESRQPQLLQVMFQQHLRRVGGVRVGLTAHRVTSPTDVSEGTMVCAESSVM